MRRFPPLDAADAPCDKMSRQGAEDFLKTINEFNVRTDFIYSCDLKAFRRLFTILMIAVNMIMVYKLLRTGEKKTKRKINLNELIQRLRDRLVEYLSRITCAISPELAARTQTATSGITTLFSTELTNLRPA